MEEENTEHSSIGRFIGKAVRIRRSPATVIGDENQNAPLFPKHRNGKAW